MPNGPLKNGTGSELDRPKPVKNHIREVPVPVFQQAAKARFLPLRSEKQLSRAIAIALLMTAVFARLLAARELASEVDSLFRFGMKNTPSALAATKSHYERLKRDYPRDRRIDYAYGIVLLNQHRFLDSAELLTDLQEDGKPDIAARRTKVWALVQGRKITDALQEMVTLSQSFRHAGDRDSESKSNDETARFIGTVFGYLELVRPGTVDNELRSKYRNVVLKNLGDRYIPVFDAGRADVAERLADLKSDRKLAQERKAASHKERLERDKATLDEDRGEIANKEEAMQSHLESVRDAQRELNVVKTQLDSLRTDRTRLTAQIVTIQAQISELTRVATTVFPTTVIDNRQPGRPNTDLFTTTTTSTILGPTSPRYAQIAALGVSLGRLNKQAFDMDRRLLTFQQRSAELSDRSLQDADALDRHDAAVQRTARHAKALEKKINRESTPPKASTAVLNSQMTALSTYLPFPYEQERKRVLAWFEK